MALLCNQDPSHFASESCKVVHWCLRFCQWPVKDNGNEHFSAIFLDEGRLAGLHFVQELPPPCFRTGAPIPPVLFAPGCQFVVGPLELLVFLCSDEGPGRQCGRRQVCDTVAAT